MQPRATQLPLETGVRIQVLQNNGMHPARLCRQGKITSHIQLFGFLERGGQSPAFDPREILMQAGDIERNPGPVCAVCGAKGVTDSPNTPRCAEPGCDAVCHRTCSGISRYLKAEKVHWLCLAHGGDYTPRVAPTTEDLPKARCKVCPTTIRTGNPRIPCKTCHGVFHKKCTGLPDNVATTTVKEKREWDCKECVQREEARNAPIPSPVEDGVVENTMEDEEAVTRDHLRIMSWNADALRTKIPELQKALDDLDIDVCMIQETKLKKKFDTPNLKGYVAVMRSDRADAEGGGLLTYVKRSVHVQPLKDVQKDGTEVATVRVRMVKNSWVHLTNVYVPPYNTRSTNDRTVTLRTDLIPAFDSSIVVGDLNGHSILWDYIQPTDARGEELETWLIDKELTVMNDGTPTRVNKDSGGESTPDLSLCGNIWKNKYDWAVGEGMGKSDHLPVIITLYSQVKHIPVLGSKQRWRSSGVDWEKFRDELEEEVEQIREQRTWGESLKAEIESFIETVNKVGMRVVRKVKPGKKTKPWMTPSVRTAIKKRNSLRRRVKEKRKEWLEACKEAAEAIAEAKQERWKEMVEGAINETDERKMWGFIKSLNGSPSSNSPNIAMEKDGKIVTSGKKKASLFLSHYAAVSNLKFTKEERDLNRTFKKTIAGPSVDGLSCQRITMRELKRAIAKMKSKGAPGVDDIPPQFLKAMGEQALDWLLEIFNNSFYSAVCPQVWRTATIIPLLKSGKPPSELASYRPVSLTSCVVKALERILADRLYHLAETNNWFSPLQADFQKNHCCEDQITRIVQAIENGFQSKPMQRSVLVLLDYSKAYDMVWKQRLLLSMIEIGVPMQMVRWLWSFLQNRQARVRFGDFLSESKTMRQGVPQGSVLSPLLFLFYINNLAVLLEEEEGEGLTVSLFADDVTLLGTDEDKDMATSEVQKVVDIVVEWSRKWKLKLNATKSEVSFFSRWTKEAGEKPEIRIGDKQIPFEKCPRLLGVILDRQLCFATQVANVRKESGPKLRMLAAISHSDWGWRKEQLKVVYDTFLKSKLNYAGAAWQPFLADSNMDVLEVIQRKAIRKITGQYMSTNTDALLLEANMQSCKTTCERACLRSVEKAKRLPTTHPLRKALDSAIAPKNDHRSWYSMGMDLSGKLQVQGARHPITAWHREPWAESNIEHEISAELQGITGRNDTAENKLQAANTMILQAEQTVTIYTDGSAAAGTRDGGAAVVITSNDPAAPVVVDTIKVKGAAFTTSCEEETRAMVAAVRWIASECSKEDTALICTDSQSLCRALISGNPGVDHVWNELDACETRVKIQWIPGHSDVQGNELADAAAKEASKLTCRAAPTTFKSTIPAIKSAIKDAPSDHKNTREIYSKFSEDRDKTQIKTRRDQVLLARIRAGHHYGLGYYRNFIDKEKSPRCNRCDAEVDDVNHWMQCDGTAEARFRTFGELDVGLATLTAEPAKCVAYSRSTIRDKPARKTARDVRPSAAH